MILYNLALKVIEEAIEDLVGNGRKMLCLYRYKRHVKHT